MCKQCIYLTHKHLTLPTEVYSGGGDNDKVLSPLLLSIPGGGAFIFLLKTLSHTKYRRKNVLHEARIDVDVLVHGYYVELEEIYS